MILGPLPTPPDKPPDTAMVIPADAIVNVYGQMVRASSPPASGSYQNLTPDEANQIIESMTSSGLFDPINVNITYVIRVSS